MRTVSPLLSMIALFSVLLLFVYFIPDTEARRGGGGKSVSRSGHASSGSFRGSQSYRHDSRGHNRSNRSYSNRDRRDNQQDRRSDGRDNRQDHRDDVRDDRRDHRDDVRDDRRRYRARRMVIGSTLTIVSYNALTCHRTIIIHVGVTYYRCGTVWYNQAYSGANVTYVVVNAPPGY